MRPHRKSRRDLQWLLEFIDADFPNLPYPEMIKFLTEVSIRYDIRDSEDFLDLGKLFKRSDQGIVISDMEEGRQWLRWIQNTVRDMFYAIMGEFSGERVRPHSIKIELSGRVNEDGEVTANSGQPSDSILRNFKKGPTVAFETHIEESDFGELNSEEFKGVSVYFTDFHSYTFVNVNGQIRLDVRPKTRYLTSLLLSDLFSCLEGVPVDSLRKCKECERFFPHFSKHDRQFCGNRCASRYLTRQRREAIKKDPEKYRTYLKKQREIMRRYRGKKLENDAKSEMFNHPQPKSRKKEKRKKEG